MIRKNKCKGETNMKQLLLLGLVIAILLSVGCAITTGTATTRSVTAKSFDIVHTGAIQRPVVADLVASETRVRGTFSSAGLANVDLQALKDLAIDNALNSVNADILLEPRFDVTTTTTGTSSVTIVVVTGYPATFRNFRNFADSDTTWTNIISEQRTNEHVERTISPEVAPNQRNRGGLRK